MKLTEDGARCFDRAKLLITDWEAFEADLRGASDVPEGLLRVVVPHAFGQQQLVAPLADYLRRHPRVAVEWLLHDGTPNFITDGIDCAIHVGTVEDPSVVALKIAEVPRSVVAAPSLLAPGSPLPAEPEDLAALPWLALRNFYRNEIRLVHEDGRQHSLSLRPRISTDSLFALRSAALLGLGVCVASSWAVAEDMAEGRLIRLAPRWHGEPLPVYLVYPYAQFYPAKLRRFVELMRNALERPALWSTGLVPVAGA